MITRLVEYGRSCDGPDCYVTDVADWTTREQAEAAAIKDGWVKCTYGRWLCPECKAKAEKARAKVVESMLARDKSAKSGAAQHEAGSPTF